MSQELNDTVVESKTGKYFILQTYEKNTSIKSKKPCTTIPLIKSLHISMYLSFFSKDN